jgi:hypothetical protein
MAARNAYQPDPLRGEGQGGEQEEFENEKLVQLLLARTSDYLSIDSYSMITPASPAL